MAVFDIIINETMSVDEVVASDVPPRYLFVGLTFEAYQEDAKVWLNLSMRKEDHDQDKLIPLVVKRKS